MQVTAMSGVSLFHKGFMFSAVSKTNNDVSKRHKNTTGESPPVCGSPSSCYDLPDKSAYGKYAFIQGAVCSLTA